MSQRQPNPDAVAYEVATEAGTYRRFDILFGTTPQRIDAAPISDYERVRLLNTPGLVVKEILPGDEEEKDEAEEVDLEDDEPAKAAPAPKAKGKKR